MNKYLAGGLAGLSGTVPMTVVMVVLHNQLPALEQHPLPPEDITQRLTERVGGLKPSSRNSHHVVTWSAHLGFGAGAGLLYALLCEKVEAPPAIKGVLFGLFIWAISYLGWLPQTKILDQPKEQSARSNALMIVAHVVWGLCLGLLAERGTQTQD